VKGSRRAICTSSSAKTLVRATLGGYLSDVKSHDVVSALPWPIVLAASSRIQAGGDIDGESERDTFYGGHGEMLYSIVSLAASVEVESRLPDSWSSHRKVFEVSLLIVSLRSDASVLEFYSFNSVDPSTEKWRTTLGRRTFG
jgi:hypothetical protein